MKTRGLEYHLANRIKQELDKPGTNFLEVLLTVARGAVLDELTGLYNKRGLEIAKKIMGESLDSGEIKSVGVIIVDLDELKQGNDSYGHEWGDKLITDAALVLQRSVRPDDDVFRIGGDEYAVLLPGVTNETLAKRISTIKKTRDEYRKDLHFSWGIGYARNSKELGSAFKKADENMYRAKRARKK